MLNQQNYDDSKNILCSIDINTTTNLAKKILTDKIGNVILNLPKPISDINLDFCLHNPKNLSNFVITMNKESALKSLKRLLKRNRRRHRIPRAPRRWLVEITNENTLGRVLSFRLTGIKVYMALLATIASIASLIVVFFTFTPVGKWIWGERNLRDQYVDLAIRLDSISTLAQVNDAYTSNILAILTDSLRVDSIPSAPTAGSDTLLAASEAERQFVERFESEQRFNLSVLSPIAAEGMIFETPVTKVGVGGPIMSVYRGTVIARNVAPDGSISLVVQHPNDFISVYSGLTDAYVTKGAKVIAGQRIGASNSEPLFELWRGGAALDPYLYIQFPAPETIER